MKKFSEEMERYSNGYKTGVFGGFVNEDKKNLAIKHNCDCLGAGVVRINWYLTRGENRHPIIKVEYHFPTLAPRKVACGYGYGIKKIWRCTTKTQLFPFSEEGMKAAISFANSL